MSKEVDLDKPLSDEDRAYLKSRSRHFDIQENDRIFGNGEFAEKDEDEVEPVFAPTPTVAAAPIEPGSDADKPPAFVGNRPYGVDRAVWGGATGQSEQEAYAATGSEPHAEQVDLGGDPESGDEGDDDEEDVAVENLTVDQLDEELKERGLPRTGDKADKVKRLNDALAKEAEEANK